MAEDSTTTITSTKHGILSSQPQDTNFLSPFGFRFILKRAPHVNFFSNQITIPSFQLGTAEMPTPFKMIPLPGDRPKFGDLAISFKVDEMLQNYLEIFNWMAKIGYPERFEQYASVKNAPTGSGQGVVSDGTVSILNSSMDPTTEFRFENMYPDFLSELDFNTTDSSINYITAKVNFKFEMMRVVSL